MIDILGCLLLLVGGSAIGMSMVMEERRRIKAITTLIHGLEGMERELALRLTPLPELLLTVASGLEEPISTLFQHCGTLAGQETQFSIIWGETLKEHSYLGEAILDILYPLGSILGRFEGDEQCRSLRDAVRSLEMIREEVRQESRRLGKVYPTLGFTVGAFLVILLL